MYNIFYRHSDTLIRSSITLFLLAAIYIFSGFNYSLWFNSNDSKVAEQPIVQSPVKQETDYIAPDSSLPKNIEDIYSTLNKNNPTPKRLAVNLQGDIIVVNRTVNDVKETFYLEYSKIYDCTIVKTDLRVKDPIQIFYHFEYDTKDEFSRSVFDFLNTHLIPSDKKVHLDKNNDGTLNLRIE